MGALAIAGATGLAIDASQRSAEQRHTMTCLAAYVAFIEVTGSSEEGISRLQDCEHARSGEEPIHLSPTEHAFVVEKYEGCLAAHLLLSTDLKTSLKEQRRNCR